MLFGSNTLLGERERALTLRAREIARAQGKRLLFDPNVRLRRWRDEREAVRLVCEVLDGAALLKVNRAEAQLLTGAADPAAAAERLVEMGAQLVVVTLGSEGALLRGAASAVARACRRGDRYDRRRRRRHGRARGRARHERVRTRGRRRGVAGGGRNGSPRDRGLGRDRLAAGQVMRA